MQAIDSNGELLGLSRTFTSSDYGDTVFTAATPHLSSNGEPAGIDFSLHGVTFTLADFDGSGSTKDFAGFNVLGDGGDLAMLSRRRRG